MKNIFLITFFCFGSVAFSQGITFTTEFKSNFNEWAIKVIEDDDGNYIYAGKIHSNLGTDNGKILKLNAQGEIIDSLYIPANNLQNSFIPNDIIQVGNKYICIGAEISSVVGKLFFIKLDKNLNIITKKEIPLTSFGGNGRVDISYLMCDSDSNLIISGGIRSPSFTPTQPYLYKVTLDGDSILAVYPQPIYSFSSFTEVIEQPNNAGYIAFGKGFHSLEIINTMMRYDTNFNLLKTDTLKPLWHFVVSPIQIEDTVFVASRSNVVDTSTPLLDVFFALMIVKITKDNDSLNQKVIEGGKLGESTVPATFDAIDEYNHFIFTTGTIRHDDGNVSPYSGTQTALIVAKTDLDLNIVWKKKIQADSIKYNVFGIIATQDGGCLIYGTTYDLRAQDYQFNTFVIKLDELGNTTWVKEDAYTQIPLTIFPNPTKDYINYKTPKDVIVQKIEIINIEGRKVKEFVEPQTFLNIQDLAQGVYLMRFFTNKDLVIKKMIKE